ncbi:MAG: hypothetical protein J6A89_07645 [Clostridia bacterium]|nr:hypothetical protein [Clostridia bacterium]
MKIKDDDVDILKWISIVEEEINVKSDRAMVITSASILDSQLEMLLKEFMITDSKIDERLFNANSSLATLSAKNSMCYYLGIISENEYKNIEIIRKIRNRFAHEIEIKKMCNDQAIIDLCNNLTLTKEMYMPETITIRDGRVPELEVEPLENIDTQTKFIRVFKNITMYLNYRSIELSAIKRKEYKNLPFLELIKNTKKRFIELNKKRYKMNIEYKQKLLEKMEKTNKNDNMDLERIKSKIQSIDKAINAYENGDLFYDLTVQPTGGSQAYIKMYDEMIKLFENNN